MKNRIRSRTHLIQRVFLFPLTYVQNCQEIKTDIYSQIPRKL